MKPKFSVGFTYTVWVDVEANDEGGAIARARSVDLGLKTSSHATIEPNNEDDFPPLVIKETT